MSKGFGKVFGDGDAKKMTTGSTPTSFKSLPKEVQTAMLNMTKRGEQISLDPSIFQSAPITSQQQQAADYFGTPISAVTPEEFQQGLATYTNPFEEQVLQNTFRDLNQQARGSYGDIGTFASDIGGFGSNRRGLLEAELQKNLLGTVGNISATSRANNFENAAGRTLADINQMRTMNQQNMGSLFDIGSMFQQQQTQNKMAPATALGYFSDLLKTVPVGGGQTSYTPLAPDGGWLTRLNKGFRETGEAKSAMDQGFGIGSGFSNSGAGYMGSEGIGGVAGGIAAMSDERLKENIIHIGKENGHNVYSFNYITQATKWIGVMAQEVLKSRPDAVINRNGYYAVDYDKLGLRMRLA
jgi:hypothetical protein